MKNKKLSALTDAVRIPMVGDPRLIEKQLDEMGVFRLKFTELCLEQLCDMPRERACFATNRILEAYDTRVLSGAQ